MQLNQSRVLPGLGQYLLDNDMMCYVGKVVKKTADHDSDSDSDVDEELGRYPGVLIPVPRGRKTVIVQNTIIATSPGRHKRYVTSYVNFYVTVNSVCLGNSWVM